MFKTVYARMLTIVLAIVLGLLAVLGTVVAILFRSQYISETEDRLLREIDDVNEIVVTHYLDVDKRTSAREEFRVITRLYDACIQLCFDSDELGRYTVYSADSAGSWAVAEEADLSRWIAEVKSGNYKKCRDGLLSGYVGFPTVTAMRPIVTKTGEELGVIFFHFNMTGVNNSISNVLKSVGVSAAIAVVIAVPVVMFLVRSVTNPIYHMTEVVNDFTRGNFSRRVKVKGTDELSNLGRTFNTMADELNTLEDARRSFVANVSHELRSPLTSMRGFLEAMDDGTIPEEERGTYIGVVLDENRRMTIMVNDLLDLARIESGQYKLSMAVFDVGEAIRRALITFMARIEAKRLRVSVELPSEPVYVDADEARITQVLHNLVDNAVKYTPEEGSLSVSLDPGRRTVRVSIRNSGPGISESDLPHVFDRFYKGEKAHTPSGTSGTGLGLSIAKLIITQHGQDITASSANGETVFTFTLKRAARPAGRKPQD